MRCSPEPHPKSLKNLPPPRTAPTELWSLRASRPPGGARPASPPPQRRHRARSLPVPRGRMATGGCFTKFALSAVQGEREVWG